MSNMVLRDAKKIIFSSKIWRDIKIVYHVDKVVPNFLQEKKAKEKKGY